MFKLIGVQFGISICQTYADGAAIELTQEQYNLTDKLNYNCQFPIHCFSFSTWIAKLISETIEDFFVTCKYFGLRSSFQNRGRKGPSCQNRRSKGPSCQ